MLKTSKSKNAGPADWEDLPDSAEALRALMKRGIFMDIVGLEGQGKSSLACTLARCGPVGYVDIDQSVDRAKKPEARKERERIKILPVRYAIGLTTEVIKESCAEAWNNMERKIAAAASTWAGGVVVDTGTETWELVRLASQGTLNPKGKRMDRVYGPINAKIRQLYRSVYRTHGKHLCTIHQLKDEYVDKMKDGELSSVKTGKFVRAGFKEVGYLSDLVVRCFKDGDEFKAEIQMCKLAPNGPSIEGMVIEGDQMDFAEIIALATGTEATDWIKKA